MKVWVLLAPVMGLIPPWPDPAPKTRRCIRQRRRRARVVPFRHGYRRGRMRRYLQAQRRIFASVDFLELRHMNFPKKI